MSDNSVHESAAASIGALPDAASESTDTDRFRGYASDYEHVRAALMNRSEDLQTIAEKADWLSVLFDVIMDGHEDAKKLAAIGRHLADELECSAFTCFLIAEDTLKNTPQDRPHRRQYRDCNCPDCNSERRGNA